MSSDSEHVDDVEAMSSAGGVSTMMFYSHKKRKIIQPLTLLLETAASPIVVTESVGSDESNDDFSEDSDRAPLNLPDATGIGREGDNYEPVAGPSGINTKAREFSSEFVVARGGVHDDGFSIDCVAEPDVERDVGDGVSSDGIAEHDYGGDNGERRDSVVAPEDVRRDGDDDGEGDDDDGDGHAATSEPGAVKGASTGRKKTRRPEKWKKNVAKSKRNSGDGYVSAASGAVIKKRSTGNPCADGCFAKVGEDGVKQIFDDFWKLGNWSAQNAYLLSVIRAVPIKSKRTKKDVSSRPCNYEYTVKHNGKQYIVCRPGFISIHGLQIGRLRYLFKKKVTDTGMCIPDKRGRKIPPNRLPDLALQRVHEHIKMLPVTQSHYTRAKSTNRVYLPSSTSIPRLYAKYFEFYKEKYNNDELKPVSEHYYRDVFTQQYNIGTAPPSKDTCTTCDLTNAEIQRAEAEGKDTTMLQQKLEAHKNKAAEAQELLRTPKFDPDPQRKVVCIDLQQTFPCPRLTTGIAYYKMKLWVYNFCIHDVKTNKSTMFIWEETSGGRGSDEIGSCWLKWLELMNSDTFNTVTIVADNCGGQNKNVVIVLTALQQVHKGRLKRVELVFLVSGHSYMPCDRSFGLIEKRIRTHDTVYTTKDYVDIIRSSNKSFRVVEMRLHDFLDLKSLMKAATIRRASQGKFSKASQIVITDTYKEGYLLKDHYMASDSVATKVRLQPGQRSFNHGNFHLETVKVRCKYNQDRKLKDTKVRHLKSLLPFYVCQDKRAWLEGLVARQEQLAGPAQDHDDEEVDDPECNTMDYVYDETHTG